jgi:hypothetical protein
MAKKATKKAAKPKNNKFSQKMLAVETVQRLDEILKDVKGSKSSVFAKDDVLKIIDEVKDLFKQESPSLMISLDEFIDEVADNIADNIDEGDFDDVDLELSGNEIYIRSVRINNSRVKELIEEITDSYFG